MRTTENLTFNPFNHPFQGDRQSKILQLKKPVYSKRIKQKRHKKAFSSIQFFDKKLSFNTIQKITITNRQNKIKRSKSDFILPHHNQQTFTKNDHNKKISHIFQNKNFNTIKHNSSKQIISKKLILRKSINFQSNRNQTNGFNKQKKNVINNYYQKLIRTHQNFFKDNKAIFLQPEVQYNEKEQNRCQANVEHKQNKNITHNKESFKLIEFIKKDDIEDQIINQLSLLRKKRNSLGNQAKNGENLKKQSLIRKNSLFLMNYLRQKQKLHQQGKNPHINNMKVAKNIKIEQNLSLKKVLQKRNYQKNIFKQKIQSQSVDKNNAKFNSIKIDPW